MLTVYYEPENLDSFSAAWVIWKDLGESETFFLPLESGQIRSSRMRTEDQQKSLSDGGEALVLRCDMLPAVREHVLARHPLVHVWDHRAGARLEWAEQQVKVHEIPGPRSTCTAVWGSRFEDATPMLLRMVEAAELYPQDASMARAVATALQFKLRRFEGWDAFSVSLLFGQGQAVLAYRLMRARRWVEHSLEFFDHNGQDVPTAFVPCYVEEAAQALSELYPQYDYVVVVEYDRRKQIRHVFRCRRGRQERMLA